MIRALLAAGKNEEAFNYSERAGREAFLDVLGSKVQLASVKERPARGGKGTARANSGLKARLQKRGGETDR